MLLIMFAPVDCCFLLNMSGTASTGSETRRTILADLLACLRREKVKQWNISMMDKEDRAVKRVRTLLDAKGEGHKRG